MTVLRKFIINGNAIYDIPSFYKEINRLFMVNQDWKIAESLDALNDLLYGGFGELKSTEKIDLIWENITKNKADLGLQTTIDFYTNKLQDPKVYNINFAKKKLIELEQGQGQTYFEIIMEIINDHPNINLVKK